MSNATLSRPTKSRSWRYLLISGVFVALFLALAGAVTYPIYSTPVFWMAFAVAVIGGAGIAWLRMRFSWSFITTVLVAIGFWLIAVVPATNPGALASLPTLGRTWVESVSSIIFGWKQLVTIDLPVGTYHGLLGPAFAVFFAASLLSLAVVWKQPRLYWFALIPLVGASIFGFAFGAAALDSTASIAGWDLPFTWSVMGGIAFVIVSLAYLSWGSRAVRRSVVVSTTGPTLADGASRRRRLRHWGIAVATVLVAAIVTGIAYSALGVPSTREVLRANIQPMRDLSKQVSPLSAFRSWYTDPTKLNGTVLSFEAGDNAPDRIRIAVMPYFDGQEYRVTPTGASDVDAALFRRMPADLASRTGSNETQTMALTLGPNAQIWIPLVDALKSVTFTGNSSALTDSFFINPQTDAGVVVPGTAAGATYALTSYLRDAPVDLATITPDSGSIPESMTTLFDGSSLKTWLENQAKKGADVSTAAGLQKLANTLRSHTYLSHALEEPSATNDVKVWSSLLSGYSFEPSASGHSVGRLEKMFKALVERETARPRGTNAELVAAAADDEQLATAVAVIAALSGYQSRVVLGFHTVKPAGEIATAAPCANGVCTGANMSAWVEVAGSNGVWAPIDVTPQYQNKISPQSQQRQDPKNSTPVTADTGKVLPPEPANPAAGASKPKDQGFVFDLAGLFEVLKFIGLALLIVLILVSPFALVIGAKIRRRRERKNTSDPSRAIIGAWDEYIDTVLDFGGSIPARSTRSEIARTQTLERASTLAVLADEAAFAPYDPPITSVDEAWELVDGQRAQFVDESSVWRRYASWLSLRSFTRHVHPVEQLRRLNTRLTFESKDGTTSGSGVVAFARYLGVQTKVTVTGWWHARRKRTSDDV